MSGVCVDDRCENCEKRPQTPARPGRCSAMAHAHLAVRGRAAAEKITHADGPPRMERPPAVSTVVGTPTIAAGTCVRASHAHRCRSPCSPSSLVVRHLSAAHHFAHATANQGASSRRGVAISRRGETRGSNHTRTRAHRSPLPPRIESQADQSPLLPPANYACPRVRALITANDQKVETTH